MAAQAEARLITPQLPRALPPTARKKVETAIEHHLSAVEALTAFLDEFDGDDADHEATGDEEPSLGSRDCVGSLNEGFAGPQHPWDQSFWASGSGTDDRELADDSDEGDAREDFEPRMAPFELASGA